ncbi:30S ribosome-binding factor RbfA [Orrella sp. 11846]|uniref:30S ribosome-binding factor RbfA n=1 Tax=Orrella sp. 11846 TaxID=3409913 RepID=UPI003B596F15
MARHKQKKPVTARNVRLAEQIQKDLAVLIQREVDTKQAGLITLSGLDLSADYAHAKVYFTVIGADAQHAEDLLNDKAGWLHSQLFKMLHIHTVPSLKFLHDGHLERGIEMARLIEEANAPRDAQASSDVNDSDSQS